MNYRNPNLDGGEPGRYVSVLDLDADARTGYIGKGNEVVVDLGSEHENDSMPAIF